MIQSKIDALGDTITTILTTNINTNDDNDKHNDYDDNLMTMTMRTMKAMMMM